MSIDRIPTQFFNLQLNHVAVLTLHKGWTACSPSLILSLWLNSISFRRAYFSFIYRGAVHSVVGSYAAIRMVAGSRPVLSIAWEWHIGLALLCGCSGALEYPTTNSCESVNKSLSLLSLSLCNIIAIPIYCLTLQVYHTLCTSEVEMNWTDQDMLPCVV